MKVDPSRLETEDGAVTEWSYAELDRQTCRLAAALRELGYGPDDAIGIYMPMVPEVVAAYFAVARIGAIVVPLFSGFGRDAIAQAEAKLDGVDNSFLHYAREIAYGHHEKWDGSGYPQGLETSQIPVYARIVAIADVFDALTSERPYKRAWTFSETIDYRVYNALGTRAGEEETDWPP